VQDQAKRTQAKNDLTQIVTAVNAFYTEYGTYPLAADDTIYSGTSNAMLLDELRAIPPATQNPRKIVFISPPDVKDPSSPRSGIGTTTGVGQFFDPWGTAYFIEIDGNYDGQIANPYLTNAGSVQLRSGAIAWSFGKDSQSQSIPGPASNKNSGTNADDVISWQ
jgi:type II secretory pathway pseudopilin PulG